MRVCAGPSVLEVFHALLRHLRVSVERDVNTDEEKREEENFQQAVISTIGNYVVLSLTIISQSTNYRLYMDIQQF